MHAPVELVRTVTRKSRTAPAKNVASAINLRTSALAEFVKNVVKKKQSAAVKMLTIQAAGAACLQLRLPTSTAPSWLGYFDSCNNRWTHSTKRTNFLNQRSAESENQTLLRHYVHHGALVDWK